MPPRRSQVERRMSFQRGVAKSGKKGLATCDIRLAGWQVSRDGLVAACFFCGNFGETPLLASPQVAGRASQVLPARGGEIWRKGLAGGKKDLRLATFDLRGGRIAGTAKDAACFFCGKSGGTSFLASPQVAGRASQVLPARGGEIWRKGQRKGLATCDIRLAGWQDSRDGERCRLPFQWQIWRDVIPCLPAGRRSSVAGPSREVGEIWRERA